MLKKVILALLVLIAAGIAVLGVAIAMQPDEFKITRTMMIKATPERVFGQVNDFRKWEGWSPWARLDPNMKVTYTGPPTGAGAAYSWAGDSNVGEGRMTIAESRPPEHIRIDLEFLKPFESKNVTEFALKPSGEATEVTWTMAGRHNLMTKAMCLVVSMDQMMGPDFEKGLAQLKTQSEAAGF